MSASSSSIKRAVWAIAWRKNGCPSGTVAAFNGDGRSWNHCRLSSAICSSGNGVTCNLPKARAKNALCVSGMTRCVNPLIRSESFLIKLAELPD